MGANTTALPSKFPWLASLSESAAWQAHTHTLANCRAPPPGVFWTPDSRHVASLPVRRCQRSPSLPNPGKQVDDTCTVADPRFPGRYTHNKSSSQKGSCSSACSPAHHRYCSGDCCCAAAPRLVLVAHLQQSLLATFETKAPAATKRRIQRSRSRHMLLECMAEEPELHKKRLKSGQPHTTQKAI